MMPTPDARVTSTCGVPTDNGTVCGLPAIADATLPDGQHAGMCERHLHELAEQAFGSGMAGLLSNIRAKSGECASVTISFDGEDEDDEP